MVWQWLSDATSFVVHRVIVPVIATTPAVIVATMVADQIGRATGQFARSNTVDMSVASNKNSTPRKVFVCCHPISAAFLDFTHSNTSSEFPDPTYHWCVQVGERYFQLNPTGLLPSLGSVASISWACENHRTDDGVAWHQKLSVGYTTFNDHAIYDAGEEATQRMPAEYDLITNNCQNLVKNILAIICPAARVNTINDYMGGKPATMSSVTAIASTPVEIHSLVPGVEGIAYTGGKGATYGSISRVELTAAEKAEKLMDEKTPTINAAHAMPGYKGKKRAQKDREALHQARMEHIVAEEAMK